MVTADPDWLIHKPGKIRNGDNTSHSLIARVAAGLAPILAARADTIDSSVDLRGRARR